MSDKKKLTREQSLEKAHKLGDEFSRRFGESLRKQAEEYRKLTKPNNPQKEANMAAATLEELKASKPEDLIIDDPQNDPYWEPHLLWLIENEPESTKKLFFSNRDKLKAKILRVVQRASLQEMILQEEGNLARDQVKEAVYQIVAPPDGRASHPEPPEPLSDQLKLQILGWSRNLNSNES